MSSHYEEQQSRETSKAHDMLSLFPNLCQKPLFFVGNRIEAEALGIVLGNLAVHKAVAMALPEACKELKHNSGESRKKMAERSNKQHIYLVQRV